MKNEKPLKNILFVLKNSKVQILKFIVITVICIISIYSINQLIISFVTEIDFLDTTNNDKLEESQVFNIINYNQFTGEDITINIKEPEQGEEIDLSSVKPGIYTVVKLSDEPSEIIIELGGEISKSFKYNEEIYNIPIYGQTKIYVDDYSQAQDANIELIAQEDYTSHDPYHYQGLYIPGVSMTDYVTYENEYQEQYYPQINDDRPYYELLETEPYSNITVYEAPNSFVFSNVQSGYQEPYEDVMQ